MPRWSDDLAQIELAAPSADWTLTPEKEAGGITAVDLVASTTCAGRLRRVRVPPEPVADRGQALEARILDGLGRAGVTDVQVRDRGEVPHGDFRAQMVRIDGMQDGHPWSGRITATFVTRPTGRFYVEITAASSASGFVTRRTCFDQVTAAVTLQGERH